LVTDTPKTLKNKIKSTPMKQYSLGIDIGYSSIKVVLIDNNKHIAYSTYQQHKGIIKSKLESILANISEQFDVSNITYGAITGHLGKALFNKFLIQRTNEIAASIEGSKHLYANAKSIIEIGGQTANYITGFNTSKKYALRISKSSLLKISTNSDCAAGTGSFLEEQASRLNISIDDYAKHAQKATTIPRIAGRCSVFAKSDIIHNQQEGVPSEDILKGVAYAIVKNYKGAVMRRLPIEPPLLFIGGVASNQAIVDALRDVLEKDESELIVPTHYQNVSSIGAAIIAQQDGFKLNFKKLFHNTLSSSTDNDDSNNTPLQPLDCIDVEDISQKHQCSVPKQSNLDQNYFLGVDIGSTSTNLVLISPQKQIVAYKYIRSAGHPLKAVQKGLSEIRNEHGEITISGLGVTGSGRYLIGKTIGADVIKDEITAQAKAAVTIDPDVDTIFEIGGQDSKYISINNGTVTDFQMNKVCAAGTGSFLDEQAQKFDLPVTELGTLAMKGKQPVNLGERCTVFIESSIASELAKGKKTEDIISGLCYSIAKNYLHRVVGSKKIGKRILLQGGIAYNQGVANALKLLTQKDIRIAPFFSITGAYGAAVLALEEMTDHKTNFIGFDHLPNTLQKPVEQEDKSIAENTDGYKERIENLVFDGYKPSLDPEKKTVGIPRSLFSYGMFPMFHTIFKELGLNVLLSDWSSEDTIKLGQEYSVDETCFPIKLVTGHVAELINKKVDYIFFPGLYNVSKPNSLSRQSYGCAYMQSAAKMLNQSMELKQKGITLLSPTFATNLGPEFMKKSFFEMGTQLGKSKEETGRAIQKGMQAGQLFEKKIEEHRKNLFNHIDPHKISFVIISKMYGVSDPVLNLGIPSKLKDMGYPVIPFFDLPHGDISEDHPNMFWPFGEYILDPAYLIRQHPNLYPILLTHHGCGPDSVLTHYFKEIMGSKPYLNIEIDEHASKVGVATRIEAFVNSLKQPNTAICSNQNSLHPPKGMIKESFSQLPQGTKICLPNLFPYSNLLKETLTQKGLNVVLMPKTNTSSANKGRRYTLTNEYYSLVGLLGDCFHQLENKNGDEHTAFLIPQTEGAEVGAQYNRLLRTKLDEENYSDIHIIAPFLEDIIHKDKSVATSIFRCLVAGDLIRVAPANKRKYYLNVITGLIQANVLNLENLQLVCEQIYSELTCQPVKKRLLAIGEPLIVFNDFLNNSTFEKLDDQQHRVVYFSFAEAMWMLWNDYVDQNQLQNKKELRSLLVEFKKEIKALSEDLKEESPFSNCLDELVQKANDTIGFYAGGFARYRQAKALSHPANIDGIITANSTYENTAISLNTIHKGFTNGNSTPLLNLSFDGNTSDNDQSKVESFIYYL